MQALADEIWGDLDGVSRTIRVYGKGRIVWGWPMSRVMAMQGITRDFEASRGLDSDLAWLHRRLPGTDIYYIANLSDQPQDLRARFRVAGREAEIWRAADGTIRPAEYMISGDRTTVRMKLGERESAFVVFRRTTSAPSRELPEVSETVRGTVTGPWEIRFTPGFGAPAKTVMTDLQPWSASAIEGIRFYSGTAVYTNKISIPAEWRTHGAALWLDLGTVNDLADVVINGQPVGSRWSPPYRVDITSAVHSGENELEVRVTNEWTNRLIGDRALPAAQRILAPGLPVTGPERRPPALPASGLLGPVTIRSIQR